MSESEDEYGSPLPPGHSKKSESSSDDDAYGPSLPSKSDTKFKTGPSRQRSNDSSDSESDSSSGESNDDRGPAKKQKTIGPVMPKHLLKGNEEGPELTHNKHIGPTLPAHLKYLETANIKEVEEEVHRQNSDSDEDAIGPSIGLKATGDELTSATEFELRAQKMHDKLTGKTQDEDSETPTGRESWMTELPSAMNKQFGLANRTFRKNEAAEMDSSWTDTPQERERKMKEGSGSKRKREPQYYVPTEKDRKMAKDIDEYNKANRPDSLLAMHEKKLKKKKKKEKKEKKKKKKKDKKPEERRPFDREVDLQVNRLDEAQRKAIIKRSQELNSRFKTGGMGTSFL